MLQEERSYLVRILLLPLKILEHRFKKGMEGEDFGLLYLFIPYNYVRIICEEKVLNYADDVTQETKPPNNTLQSIKHDI